MWALLKREENLCIYVFSVHSATRFSFPLHRQNFKLMQDAHTSTPTNSLLLLLFLFGIQIACG